MLSMSNKHNFYILKHFFILISLFKFYKSTVHCLKGEITLFFMSGCKGRCNTRKEYREITSVQGCAGPRGS